MKKQIMITGYGIVGQAFVQLIKEKARMIEQTYGFSPVITGIQGSKGGIYAEQGLDLDHLLSLGIGSFALQQYAEHMQTTLAPPKFQADVLVESTPSQLQTGGAALSYMQQAIEARMHIVALSKGALVTHYPALMTASAKAGVIIKYSGATAAALPTLDIGLKSLAGTEVLAIEGILNGTTNYILTRMAEDQLTYEQALHLAQEMGIAESNPTLDVSGLDSACKILLLGNAVLGATQTIKDVEVIGIEAVTPKHIQEAQQAGQQIKLIALAKCQGEHISMSVRPAFIDRMHPLYGVYGTNKAVHFQTAEMGSIVCSGGASNPRAAAAAALKDMINLFRTDRL